MAIDRALEVRRLAEADHHVADAERAVSRQILRVEKLRCDATTLHLRSKRWTASKALFEFCASTAKRS